jgi:hypothetical protein
MEVKSKRDYTGFDIIIIIIICDHFIKQRQFLVLHMKVQAILILAILATILSSLTLSIDRSPIPKVIAEDDEENVGKYHTLAQLSAAIDEQEFDDDDINFDDFKNSTIFRTTSIRMQECIKDANELGNNLADYEIYDCEEEKEKVSS